MKKLVPLLLLLSVGITNCWAQTHGETDDVQVAKDSGIVTIASKGQDVRNVLFDLFSQSKKSFVLEPNVRFVLYLALTGVQFEEALDIVCSTAKLQYEVNNGIYYVSRIEKPEPTTPKVITNPAPVAKPKITDEDLKKKVTTRLAKADIRAVFSEFSKQTDVQIEVDKAVPAYKVDAFLIGTSLKYAIDVVTKAAGLVVVRTDPSKLLIKMKS